MRRSWLSRGWRGGGIGEENKGKREKAEGKRQKGKLFSLVPSPFSLDYGFSLQAVALQPPVEGTAAEAERLGGLADVAVVARHRLLDQEALDVLQAHVLE